MSPRACYAQRCGELAGRPGGAAKPVSAGEAGALPRIADVEGVDAARAAAVAAPAADALAGTMTR